eukprot:3941477-Rhodomonas_salina.5
MAEACALVQVLLQKLPGDTTLARSVPDLSFRSCPEIPHSRAQYQIFLQKLPGDTTHTRSKIPLALTHSHTLAQSLTLT